MKNLSLNQKIMIVLGVVILGCLAISYSGLSRMAAIMENLEEIAGPIVKRDQLTSEIVIQQRQVTILNKDIIVERSPERMAAIIRTLDEVRAGLFKTIEEYERLATPPELEVLTRYRSELTALNEINAKIRELSLKNLDAEVAEVISKDETPARDKLRATTKALNEITAKQLALKTDEAKTAYQSAKTQVTVISIVSMVAGLLLAFVILREVNRSIDRVIENLRDNTNQVTSAAQQIASSSEQLSQAATEQAASLEETSATIEEMNSMIQKNSENSRRTSDLATSSESGAIRGQQVVHEMISAIGEINSANTRIMHQVNESNQQIADITKVIAEIGSKTKVINDIVFQTKLLSFNASVEAARAGEHGKGFAVVAEEVGNLAQMSGNAAKEISDLLDGSIRKVEGIVQETKGGVEKLISEGRAKVEAGTKIAEQCGEVLSSIVTNIASVAQMSKEISTASEEQARGAHEISKAMTQLDQVTQQNSASSEETASAAEELSSQAEVLRGVVHSLIATIKGANAREELGSHGASDSKKILSHSGPSAAPRVSSDSGQRVVHLASHRAARSRVAAPKEAAPAKLAVGSDMTPSEDDPRFKEI